MTKIKLRVFGNTMFSVPASRGVEVLCVNVTSAISGVKFEEDDLYELSLSAKPLKNGKKITVTMCSPRYREWCRMNMCGFYSKFNRLLSIVFPHTKKGQSKVLYYRFKELKG